MRLGQWDLDRWELVDHRLVHQWEHHRLEHQWDLVGQWTLHVKTVLRLPLFPGPPMDQSGDRPVLAPQARHQVRPLLFANADSAAQTFHQTSSSVAFAELRWTTRRLLRQPHHLRRRHQQQQRLMP